MILLNLALILLSILVTPRKRVIQELNKLPAPSDYAKPHKYWEEKKIDPQMLPPIYHH